MQKKLKIKKIKTTRSSLFSAGKSNTTSSLRGILTLQPFDEGHNLVLRDLDGLSLTQDITSITFMIVYKLDLVSKKLQLL